MYAIALFRSTADDNYQIQKYDVNNTLLQILLKDNYVKELESFLDGTSIISFQEYVHNNTDMSFD